MLQCYNGGQPFQRRKSRAAADVKDPFVDVRGNLLQARVAELIYSCDQLLRGERIPGPIVAVRNVSDLLTDA